MAPSKFEEELSNPFPALPASLNQFSRFPSSTPSSALHSAMSLALLRSLRQSILKPWLASPSSTQHTQWHIPQAEREEEEEEAEEEGGGEHQNREKGEKECGCFPYEMLGGSPLILNEGSTGSSKCTL